MNKRIALVLTASLVASSYACTPEQAASWVSAWTNGTPEVKASIEQHVAAYRYDSVVWTAGRPCAEAYDYAMVAGFAPTDWPTLSRLCWRESRGDNTAVSRTHDYCWWQINRTHRSALILRGIIESSMEELLADKQACANAAKYVHDAAGWTAWMTY